jgi:hypothetical protein
MDIVVCYSGGHSSALSAIEAVNRYGKENVILLNHDISPHVEHEDIKRFKREVADYLGLQITYANRDNWEELTPLALSIQKNAFQARPGQAFCTHFLKTRPFQMWLSENYPASSCAPYDDMVVIYGFDAKESERIERRTKLLEAGGYKSDYPLAFWERTINNTEEIGIERPITYKLFKHANCMGCLKAGRQHWYVVYCVRPDIWEEALEAESVIGHSIIKGVFLRELEPQFKEMRYEKGICPTEKDHASTFWAQVRKAIPDQDSVIPCDCAI